MGDYTKLALAALLLAAGCSGELTELDGIYEIDTWTVESGGCSGPGESVLEQRSESYFGIAEAELFGYEYLQGGTCTDLETCRETADGSQLFFVWTFDRGDDSDGWRGTLISAYPLDDACGGSVIEQRLTRLDDDRARIEVITTQVTGLPLGDDGTCDTDPVSAAAEDMPCAGRELLEGVLVEAF